MALTATASAILEHMEPNGTYDAQQLRRFAPDLNLEGLHEVMRELWVQRQVERVGPAAWRRHRSMSPAVETPRPDRETRGGAERGRKAQLRPEDLFDHSGFEGLFK